MSKGHIVENHMSVSYIFDQPVISHTDASKYRSTVALKAITKRFLKTNEAQTKKMVIKKKPTQSSTLNKKKKTASRKAAKKARKYVFSESDETVFYNLLERPEYFGENCRNMGGCVYLPPLTLKAPKKNASENVVC